MVLTDAIKAISTSMGLGRSTSQSPASRQASTEQAAKQASRLRALAVNRQIEQSCRDSGYINPDAFKLISALVDESSASF